MNSVINNIVFGFLIGFLFIHFLIYYTSFGEIMFLTYRKFNPEKFLRDRNAYMTGNMAKKKSQNDQNVNLDIETTISNTNTFNINITSKLFKTTKTAEIIDEKPTKENYSFKDNDYSDSTDRKDEDDCDDESELNLIKSQSDIVTTKETTEEEEMLSAEQLINSKAFFDSTVEPVSTSVAAVLSTITSTSTSTSPITTTSATIAKKINLHDYLFNIDSEIDNYSNENNTLVSQQKPLVHTKGCNILSWPVFDFETTKLFDNLTNQKLSCEDKKFKQIQISRYNGTYLKIRASNKLPEKRCFAVPQPFRSFRDHADSINYGEPVEVPLRRMTDFADAEFVKIQCFEIDSKINDTIERDKSSGKASKKSRKGVKKKANIKKKYMKLIREELVPLIPTINNDNSRREKPNLPNVLLLGLDSVSRLNYERHFTLTKQLLSGKNFYTLYGYNKVGLNTFPNMYPLLTGNHPSETLLNESTEHYFDKENLIWKEYSAKNIRTLLLEDWPHFTIFNYLKPGFRHKPTDYYMRPFALSINDDVDDRCYMGRMEIDLYYEYVYDFVAQMVSRNESYFGFVFQAHLTHDVFNYAGFADASYHHLLSKLFENDLLKNTVLILFSDHGIRFGKIRQTHSGEIEARLPFCHIHVPEWWPQTQVNNLITNQHRLSTPFDIHATLKHIVNGVSNNSLPYGISLFDEIPESRNCSKAGIAEHFCSCHEDIPITKNLDLLKPFGKLVIRSVNKLLKHNFDKCHKLKFDRITSGYRRKILLEDEDDRNEIRVLLIQVIATPGGAVFEATVRVKKGSLPEVVGEISRLNKYGNQSYCIDDVVLERYCFCK